MTKNRRLIWITFPVLLLFGIYFMGPEPDRPVWNPDMPSVPQNPAELENYVARQERQHKLKQDNEARILWADSSRKKTGWSVVYLHGFSASQEEGDPVHMQFAKTFGCNLYLARMADHGIDTTEQLLYFTPDRWWKSSKEALAIGKALGEKVILMSTSGGSTMALTLASEYPQDVGALINMSPCIAINDARAQLLNEPWGLQMARLSLGAHYRSFPKDSLRDQYWNNPYRLEALVQLQEALDEKMTRKTFEKITCPSLTLYYYKNDQEQDPTVKVSAILEMNKFLGTTDSMKDAIPVPGAGNHVLASYIVSKDLETVSREARKFALDKLGMKSVNE